jgi:hypothetical protein
MVRGQGKTMVRPDTTRTSGARIGPPMSVSGVRLANGYPDIRTYPDKCPAMSVSGFSIFGPAGYYA